MKADCMLDVQIIVVLLITVFIMIEDRPRFVLSSVVVVEVDFTFHIRSRHRKGLVSS